MKLSKYFYVTLRETPSDATMPSHIFLMRGGYIKPVSTGIYSMMPMGFRVIQKIVNIIREEMNKIGGIEVDLPVVQTAELWSESGRYQAIGEELLRFKDRNNHNMVLAMTHEEAMTDLVRYVLNSYKQLPVMLYQFKTKYRDEARETSTVTTRKNTTPTCASTVAWALNRWWCRAIPASWAVRSLTNSCSTLRTAKTT